MQGRIEKRWCCQKTPKLDFDWLLHTSWKKKEDGDLLSADGGAVVGVRTVSALESVSVSGGRAAGEPSGQPGVAPPLSAGPWSCG